MEKSPSPSSTKEMSLKQKNSIEVLFVNSKLKNESKAEEPEVFIGKPNKKIIKLSELMTNMDPLEYFSRFLDIPEMILKHLNGKYLLAASEVSPSYYNLIASSKVLMENIQVVFGKNRTLENTEDLMKIKVGFRDKYDTEDYDLLKNSSRLYQNIEIKLRRAGDYVTNSELDLFHSKAHEWKIVSLDNVYFRKKLDIWRLLSAIETSVESICVGDYGYHPLEDPSSEIESFVALKFPKLKKLKMTFTRNGCGGTWTKFLLNSVAIEELDLGDRSEKVGKDILTKMLENFDKLTTLHIDLSNINLIFVDESWKQFKFKLKSLAVLFFRYSDLGSNFRNFLKSQSDHLKELTTELHVVDRETFGVIMKMPKLKNLHLKYFGDFTENEVPIKISNSITELTLLKCDNPVSLKFLLDSMPKISHLTLDLIDEERFKMLKSTKRKFEKLKVCNFKGVGRKEIEEIMTDNYTSLEIVKSV